MEGDIDPSPDTEPRPPKRMRRASRDSGTESDSQSYLDHYLDDSDIDEGHYQNWPLPEEREENPHWHKHEIVGSDFISNQVCQYLSRDKWDTICIQDNCFGCSGNWKVCRNPLCYRCVIITEAELDRPMHEFGIETIKFVATLREEPGWSTLTPRQK
jgi:hypothetical protein